MLDTLCEKSLISDKNPVIHSNICSQTYNFTVFVVHLAVQFDKVHRLTLKSPSQYLSSALVDHASDT